MVIRKFELMLQINNTVVEEKHIDYGTRYTFNDGDNVITIELTNGLTGEDDDKDPNNSTLVDDGGPGYPKFIPSPVGTVGGEAYPVNKAGLLAPWIAIAVIIAAGGGYLVSRKIHN